MSSNSVSAMLSDGFPYLISTHLLNTRHIISICSHAGFQLL